MTQTIQLDRNRVSEWEPTVEEPNRVSSLSVYAIPQAVELRRAADGRLFTITFDYPGGEKPGKPLALDDDSPAVTVLPSLFTQKVMEVEVVGPPTPAILREVARRLALAAGKGVPLARRLSYLMSAAVIEKVVSVEKSGPFSAR